MKCFYFIIFLFILIACERVNENQSQRIKIPIGEEPALISVDSLFKSMVCVPLETTEKSLLVDIDECCICDTFIYVFDRKQQVIFKFDKEGKFQDKLDKKGRAPGEYLSLDDFYIDDTLMYILSSDNQKILIYNLDFKFIRDMKSHAYPTALAHLNNQLYIFNNYGSSDLNNFYVLNSEDGEIIGKHCPFLKKQKGVAYRRSAFAPYGDDMYCFLPYDYSIYKIDAASFEKVWDIDFGKDHMLPSVFNTYSYEERRAFKKRYASPMDSPILGIDNLYLSDKYLYFSFSNGVLSQHYFYWKKTGKENIGIISPSKHFFFATNGIIYMNDEYCIIKQRAEQICRRKEQNLEIPHNLEKVLVDDNPILCFFFWKN